MAIGEFSNYSMAKRIRQILIRPTGSRLLCTPLNNPLGLYYWIISIVVQVNLSKRELVDLTTIVFNTIHSGIE